MINIVKYKCEYCHKIVDEFTDMLKHESVCSRNPNNSNVGYYAQWSHISEKYDYWVEKVDLNLFQFIPTTSRNVPTEPKMSNIEKSQILENILLGAMTKLLIFKKIKGGGKKGYNLLIPMNEDTQKVIIAIKSFMMGGSKLEGLTILTKLNGMVRNDLSTGMDAVFKYRSVVSIQHYMDIDETLLGG